MGGARAEETLRGVVLGVFNDFLDGDMEVVRTLLRECHFYFSILMNEPFEAYLALLRDAGVRGG